LRRISTTFLTSERGIGAFAGNCSVAAPDRNGVSSSPRASTTAPLAGKRL